MYAGHRRIRKTHGPSDGTKRIHGGEDQKFAGQILFATRTRNGERQLLVRAKAFTKRPALT